MSTMRRPSSGNPGIASPFPRSTNAGGTEDRQVVGVVTEFSENFGIVLTQHRSGAANRERRLGHFKRRPRILELTGHRMVDVDKEAARGKLGVADQVRG